jgi:hypothetical protein
LLWFAAILACGSTTPVEGRTEDVATPLAVGSPRVEVSHGRAWTESGELVIQIGDKPGPCGTSLGGVEWSALVTFRVPPGPGGRFFAGAPIGAPLHGWIDGARIEHPASIAIVELQPFELALGARVRGTLEFPEGTGTFDAEICALQSNTSALPETVASLPLHGMIDGRTFEPTVALFQPSRVEEGEPPRLDMLRFYSDPHVDCENFGEGTRDGLVLLQIGGTGSLRPLVDSPQPAWAAALGHPVERGHVVGRMPAWIRFDRIAFEAGARVTGELVVEQAGNNGPVAHVEGRFDAQVCPL